MLGLVPKPAQLVARTGRHVITRATVVHAAPVFAAVARRFARDVADPFGFEPAVSTRSATSAAGIHLRLQSSLPAEGYRLEVSPSQVIIHASAPAGAFYALRDGEAVVATGGVSPRAGAGHRVGHSCGVH